MIFEPLDLLARLAALVPRPRAMTWAQRLKRVFGIESCEACGGKVRVIASIENPA